jgi:DNA ligase-1
VMQFDGPAYAPAYDDARLTQQHLRIRKVMLDKAWRTLAELEVLTNDPPASISAQLRHLRKKRFGSYVVERRVRGDRKNGLYEYRLLPPSPDAQPATRRGTIEQLRARIVELENENADLRRQLQQQGSTLMIKPMLAAAVEDASRLLFPLIASPKIDGIRALMLDGKLLSRSLKPIPNHYVRETLEAILPDGLDGELLVGKTFQDCTSGIMSHEGEPDFQFWVFDYVNWKNGLGPLVEYHHRLGLLATRINDLNNPRVVEVPTQRIECLDDLVAYENEALAAGFEGVMLRDPKGPYKCGRSTAREGYLLKLKRFEDAEAVIVGVEELMHNENEAKTNELGLMKRSSAKDGKVPGGTLGALRCITMLNVRFNIGAGFTQADRDALWAARDIRPGTFVKYKHQPFGAKDAPRLPVFLGLRSTEDL